MNSRHKYNYNYFKIITLNSLKDLMSIPMQDLKQFHTRNFKGDLFNKIYKEAVQLEYQNLKKSNNDVDTASFSKEKNKSYRISPYKDENYNLKKIIPEEKKNTLKNKTKIIIPKVPPKIKRFDQIKNLYKKDVISYANDSRNESSSDSEIGNRRYNDDNINYIKYKKISNKDKYNNRENLFHERENVFNKSYNNNYNNNYNISNNTSGTISRVVSDHDYIYDNNNHRRNNYYYNDSNESPNNNINYSNNDNNNDFNYNFNGYRNRINADRSNYNLNEEEEEKNNSASSRFNRINRYSYYNRGSNSNITNTNNGSSSFLIEEEKFSSPIRKEKKIKNNMNYINEENDYDEEYNPYRNYYTDVKISSSNLGTKRSIASRNSLFNDNEKNENKSTKSIRSIKSIKSINSINNKNSNKKSNSRNLYDEFDAYDNFYEANSLSKSSYDLRNRSKNSNFNSINSKNYKFDRKNSKNSSSYKNENSDSEEDADENELSADDVSWSRGSGTFRFKKLLNNKKNNDTSSENDSKEEENNEKYNNKNNNVKPSLHNLNFVIRNKAIPYRNNNNYNSINTFKSANVIDPFPLKKITFTVKYDTHFGENLGISGSIFPFGNWNQNNIMAMNWNNGNLWTGELEINNMIPKSFEFKFVVTKNKNIKKWESGNNHKFNLDEFRKDFNMEPKGKYQEYEYEYNRFEKVLNLRLKANSL